MEVLVTSIFSVNWEAGHKMRLRLGEKVIETSGREKV